MFDVVNICENYVPSMELNDLDEHNCKNYTYDKERDEHEQFDDGNSYCFCCKKFVTISNDKI